MSESTKGGNVILDSVRVPDHVNPGETFEVEALVSNGAAYISVADADDCKRNHTAGYSLEVVFEMNGQQRVAGPACHLTAAIGSLTETYSKTFTAPETDELEINVWVRLPGSGSETDPMTRRISVSSDDPTEAPPAADDSPNYPWNDDNETTDDSDDDTSNGGFFASLFGGGGGGGSGPLGQIQGLMAMVVVVMLIGVVMQSGALGGASS